MVGEWNIQEAIKVVASVIGAATVLYQIVLYTRGPLLRSVINPQRVLVAYTGAGVAMLGYGRLAWTAKSWDPVAVAAVVKPLVTDEVTPVSVVWGMFAVVAGALIAGLAVYCWLTLPPDPACYRRDSHPKARARDDVQKVLNAYTRLAGGLESAGLIVARLGPRLAPDAIADLAGQLVRSADAKGADLPYLIECVSAREVRRSVKEDHDRQLGPADHEVLRRAWLEAVLLDADERIAGLAAGRRGLLGVPEQTTQTYQCGGLISTFLHGPVEADGVYVILYGITLDRNEVKNHRFEEHFDMLRTALLHVVPRVELLIPAAAAGAPTPGPIPTTPAESLVAAGPMVPAEPPVVPAAPGVSPGVPPTPVTTADPRPAVALGPPG